MVDVNGKKQILEKVQHELLESPIDVYNFTVEDNHNYFVGNSGVLVHNSDAICAGLLKFTGSQIELLKTGSALLGISMGVLFAKIMAGVLTWDSLTIPVTYVDDTELSKEIELTLPRQEPPKNEERKYYFAYVLPGGKTLKKVNPAISLTEMSLAIILLNDFEEEKHFFETISYNTETALIDGIRAMVKKFHDFLKEKNVGLRGAYTKNRGDARRLVINIESLAESYGFDDLLDRVLKEKPENHYEPGEVHYEHFHINFIDNKETHVWFGSKIG